MFTCYPGTDTEVLDAAGEARPRYSQHVAQALSELEQSDATRCEVQVAESENVTQWPKASYIK